MSESDVDPLISALLGEDELGAVVRAHIHIESVLIDFIEHLITRKKYLDAMRLNFGQRVDLALALGLQDEYGAPLKSLGKIRNDFAHKPNARLTRKHVTDLYGALSPEDRTVVIKSFEATKQTVEGSYAQAFKKLEPKDRFVLIVISLRAVLLTAIQRLEEAMEAQGLKY